MALVSPQDPGRRRDMQIGLAIIVLAFLGCLGLSLWAKRESMPQKPRLPEAPTTVELPGFPRQVKPFDLLARARGMTPRDIFRGFVAEGVKPDGTMDFTRENTQLSFVFQSEPGLGPQPHREGGTLPRRSYCGKQAVRVAKAGIALEPDVTDLPCSRGGVVVEVGLPKVCNIEGVWATAKKRKIRATSARIEYYQAHKGPAYRFSAGRDHFVVSASDCSKILKGKDERGQVP
ncbi:MAG TPA: hypothetical protein VLC09_03095 [Polyangiaceae bacterium]|nr:hypothetical protein [Polyangiaceae bacterium]